MSTGEQYEHISIDVIDHICQREMLKIQLVHN
jgi:hypothetical protein